ncbi:hypothetical protein GCM10027515_02170 [Schumannella luteola]|uniref:Uncharacterized protein n=1 Tax=Schumannella luteola TaxID=472059 RepID=A0A852YBH1_9MICO|nr:hypothetical protein [Schumannella luteola]NYG98644.1 hypothetical protein [Schumannella luteola]TPX02612.1 hypothetical protein FJ656_21760 [Schumannella luteola]
MGWFGRKPSEDDLVAEVTRLARTALAERGIETVLESTGDPANPLLRADGSTTYQLGNLIAQCHGAPQRQWPEIVQNHIAIVDAAMHSDRDAVLDAEALRTQIRTRLLADLGPEDPTDLGYARPLAPGLVLALGIDFPDTVATLTGAALGDLAIGLDEAYELGQRNADAEPIDERDALSSEITILVGDSLFIATKVANMEHLVRTEVGPAPHGVIFAVPHRSLIALIVVRDAQSLVAVGQLKAVVDGFASGEYGPLPGGLISPDLYFWFDGEIERITGNPDLGPGAVDARGRLGEVASRLDA